MPTKLIIGLVVVPVLFLGTLLTADYAVVDVREGGPHGMRVIVPVPLSLARMAMSFAPAELQYVAVPEIAEYLPHAERIVAELRDVRDGVLVSVEQQSESVLIEKSGNALEIHVDDGDAVVDVVLPLHAVMDVVRSYDGEGFDTRDLIRAAGRASGNVVHVKDGGDEVNVWVW